jgi:hypothetical protein
VNPVLKPRPVCLDDRAELPDRHLLEATSFDLDDNASRHTCLLGDILLPASPLDADEAQQRPSLPIVHRPRMTPPAHPPIQGNGRVSRAV